MEGFFRHLKAFLPLFSLCWGFFATFLFLMGGFSHYLKALLLRFSLFGRPFSPFTLKAFLLLFSLCGGLSAPFFLWGGFFPPFEGLSALFFLHVRVLFLWGPFLACPPPPTPLPKFRPGLMPAFPLTPMSNM